MTEKDIGWQLGEYQEVDEIDEDMRRTMEHFNEQVLGVRPPDRETLPRNPPRKDGNPKDIVATAKVPMSIIPPHVVAEVSLALAEGRLKYGGSNWREDGIRASVYVDAVGRHLGKFVCGEDIDAPSGINHLSKAIAGLVVMRDAMLHGNWTDDRPPKSDPALWASYDAAMEVLIERYGDIQPTHVTEVTHGHNK